MPLHGLFLAKVLNNAALHSVVNEWGDAPRRNDMATTIMPRAANRGKTLRVIHRASVTVAAAGRELSVAGGAPVPPTIQTTMTVVTAHEQAAKNAKTSSHERILTFAARSVARGGGRQFLIGWAPGRGSDRNATVTEAVEW
jgi:hypothetical protein